MQFTTRIIGGSVLPLLITGCALFSDDEAIKLVGAQPDGEQCRFVSQAVGQGGGDIVPASAGAPAMREDAIDNISAIARLRGGDVIYVSEVQNDNLSFDGETIGTIIGHVYRCR